MAQYDGIGETYNISEELPFRKLKTNAIMAVLQPGLRPGLKAIDFACGTGYFSAKLLDWGYSEVTGVDISSSMIDGAKNRFQHRTDSSQAIFHVADASKPRLFSPNNAEAYFDLAFGAWFLNYAPDMATLVGMFKTAAVNLNNDGMLLAVIQHPTDDLDERARIHDQPPFSNIIPQQKYTSALENGLGWNLQITLSDTVNFMTFHLKREVYEQAARLGGFRGQLQWIREERLGAAWASIYPGLTEQRDWELRDENPHYGFLVVHKN